VNCPATDVGTFRITDTRGPPGLAISGEIDETSYGDLVDMLERFADGLAEVHVGLAGMEYVPPGSREVLRILGWDTMPGLFIDECPEPAPRVRARGA
jgi:hypothetical protein